MKNSIRVLIQEASFSDARIAQRQKFNQIIIVAVHRWRHSELEALAYLLLVCETMYAVWHAQCQDDWTCRMKEMDIDLIVHMLNLSLALWTFFTEFNKQTWDNCIIFKTTDFDWDVKGFMSDEPLKEMFVQGRLLSSKFNLRAEQSIPLPT